MLHLSKLSFFQVAVKDTSKELWEIAVELDKAHCGQGCGSKAITLFLKRLNEITTKNQFQFLVEVDNIPCQSCMKKAGQQDCSIRNKNRLCPLLAEIPTFSCCTWLGRIEKCNRVERMLKNAGRTSGRTIDEGDIRGLFGI